MAQTGFAVVASVRRGSSHYSRVQGKHISAQSQVFVWIVSKLEGQRRKKSVGVVGLSIPQLCSLIPIVTLWERGRRRSMNQQDLSGRNEFRDTCTQILRGNLSLLARQCDIECEHEIKILIISRNE